MGRPKGGLLVRGEPLLLRQLRILGEAGVRERWVCLGAGASVPEALPSDVGVLRDAHPGIGPIAGLEQALTAATAPLVLVLAVDLPELTAGLLREWIASCRPGCGWVPRTATGFEPLAALYPREAALAVTQERLARGEFGLQGLVARLVAAGELDVMEVSDDRARQFLNWNCPGDFVETSPEPAPASG